MTALAPITADTLPSLLARATRALDSARNSAEVLEARDMSRAVYDAAKSAGRMAIARRAHDDVIAAIYRAQADAMLVEARAKMRLADEYDAAMERGEVQRHGGQVPRDVVADNIPSTADLGIRRDEMHDARHLRDAERADPGLAARAVEAMMQRGEEPTRAELRRSVIAAVDDARKPTDRKNPNHTPDPFRDRVLSFIDHCEQLSQITDVAAVARYRDPLFPHTSARLRRVLDAASDTLRIAKEAINAESNS